VSGEHPSAVHTLGLRGRAAHTESMSNLHSRVSAGVPRGGQFAATAHAETDVTLSSETGPAPDTSWPRIDRGECWTQPQQPKPGQSLAERFPAVAAQWHLTKNGTLTSSRVKGGARQNVWWVCQKGHEWQSPVNNRIAKGRGCPVCAGQKTVAGSTTSPPRSRRWPRSGILPATTTSPPIRCPWAVTPRCGGSATSGTSGRRRSTVAPPQELGAPSALARKQLPGSTTSPPSFRRWPPNGTPPVTRTSSPTAYQAAPDKKCGGCAERATNGRRR
jgi:hypothetical protein